jgi:hypothetical protein
MIDFGLLVFVVIAYWSGHPGLAFVMVLLGLLSGILGLIKAFTNRRWYESQALEAGVTPNYAMLVGTKIVVFAILLWAAWFTGTAANYF